MTTAPDAPNREQVMRSCYGGFDENKGRQLSEDCQALIRRKEIGKITFTPEGIQIGNPGTIHTSKNAFEEF